MRSLKNLYPNQYVSGWIMNKLIKNYLRVYSERKSHSYQMLKVKTYIVDVVRDSGNISQCSSTILFIHYTV